MDYRSSPAIMTALMCYLESDLLEFLESGELFDQCIENSDFELYNPAFIDSLTPDNSPVSEEPSPPLSPMKNLPQDIPTNAKEWFVPDQNSGRQRPPRLYEFLILLLHKPHYVSYASYKDETRGLFEIFEPEKVAKLWEQVKNRQAIHEMTYDKFARAIRWYYPADIMVKTNARYTFQFSSRTLAGIIIDENNNITINPPVLTPGNDSKKYLMQ